MVSYPKKMNAQCMSCNKHREHKVSLAKRGKENPKRLGARRYAKKQSGYGGQTKPIFRRKAKNTKKVVLKLECNFCHAKKMVSKKRAKTVEISNEKYIKSKKPLQY